jgi:hypothetical protein
VLGFDGFEIVYSDDDLVARLSFPTNEKSAGFETSSGKCLESFPNRDSEAAYDIMAEPDGNRLAVR